MADRSVAVALVEVFRRWFSTKAEIASMERSSESFDSNVAAAKGVAGDETVAGDESDDNVENGTSMSSLPGVWCTDTVGIISMGDFADAAAVVNGMVNDAIRDWSKVFTELRCDASESTRVHISKKA